MRKFKRVALRAFVALVILAGACALAGVFIVRSGWFRERVRGGIIEAIENTTGGRVELGSFRFDWRHLVASVTPLVLHGTETAGEPALLRVESVTVGLRIVSLFERRIDLSYLRIEQPQARFVFYENGANNFPEPPQHHAFWSDVLVDLAVSRFEVNHGLVEYDGRDVPIDIRGEDFHLLMTRQQKGPGYRGEFTSKRVRMVAENAAPAEFDTSAAFAFDKSGIDFQRLRLATRQSRFDLAGKLEDFHAPHGTFSAKASVAGSEAVSVFSLPLTPAGSAAFDGRVTVSFADGFDYSIAGRVGARGLGYSYQRMKIQDAEIRADLLAVPDNIVLQRATATVLGSTVTGQASLVRGKNFHFAGDVDGLSVRDAVNLATERPITWNGSLSGNLTADVVLGERLANVQAALSITPASDGTPIEGRINVSYDQSLGALRLGDSYLATPSTRVDVDGTLGESVQVRARSSNLDDVLPVLALASDDAPREMPLKLGANSPPASPGNAALTGVISGPLDNPRFSGQVGITNASVEGHGFDRFSGDVEASRHNLAVRRLVLGRGNNPGDGTTLDGQVEIAAPDGNFEQGSLTARLNLHNAHVGILTNEFLPSEYRKKLGFAATVMGTVSGAATVSGTLRNPTADFLVQAEKPAAFGEQVDRLRASVHYDARSLRLAAGEADAGPGKISFQGSFEHRENDWNNGEIRFDLAAQTLPASRIAVLSRLQPGLDGTLNGNATGEARLSNGELTLASVNGDLAVSRVTLNREALGDLSVTARTQSGELGLSATAHIQQSTIQGQGGWRLEGDYPGSAVIRLPRTSIAALHRIIMIGGTPQQEEAAPPFEGFAEGSVTVSVALQKLFDFQAVMRIDTLQINPKPTQTLQLGVQMQDVILRNAEPIVISVSAKEARIQSARFTARDTNLEAAGAIPFGPNTGADLTVRGSMNLIILQLLNPGLLARGNASLQTSIRGSLRDPLVNGRMELKDASLYLNDLPNGLDKANGVVFFDRNRATIDNLKGETGGGLLSMSGFVEFGSTLVYRLQAVAQEVRVRYPEDVSITASAQLALTGTSEASTISGVLTLNRAAFNPHADLGNLLAQSAKAVAEPQAPSDYLRGMRFDVRIESAPNFDLETSLTQNVQAEVDLRLRGTPLRPVLLGSISVNEGEVQVFGNQYTVNRGNIRFQNAVRIEPIFDVSLETKARGVIVTINLSGTTQKLNVNYSSDPPLQTREIITLLAVGRGPSQSSTISDTLSADSTSFVEAGGGLLGQAVSEQLSSRLQRFFGASRVKIDPLLTGVENIPEARLTFEQQVSKDVTLTYITNLNRTQEQIVQVQWDVSRKWSAVAVRDSNGLFGIDLTYRKRFK